ncbi:MAG: UDP-2,4-diacetamido-2,4,6-trideoxy-beta-L-altropyranose hydrolase [Roseburia sp.]|nr:UDP-2,4-diacetamido-2,4,6-trideoxy-beta-L-altropyranose hydrolase [Roseburia sp.]MCM1278814.1 UDP-2,4-diacetamido-2,4,6-trideoxy-beta-L-altropyranose hydrolase [Robinsoniella sp.]
MKKCLIRVDSNGIIGTGHLMRCLAIAGELKKSCQVVFLLADEMGTELLENEGFSYRCLESQWNQMEEEIDKICPLIKEEGAEVLLIDSYQVTRHYLKCVKELVKTVYIDDLHEFPYPCNILINYAVYAEDYDYEKTYQGTDTKLLIGCGFAPLRQEFSALPEKIVNQQTKNVLVLTGGTDSSHFALQFVQQIVGKEEYKGMTFHIICGKYNQDIEQLRQLEKEKSHVQVYCNLFELGKFMRNADIAISAGGTTLYELAACGTPTIGYSLADNQLENLKSFADKGCLLSVGDIRQGFPKEELLKRLGELADSKKRQELSHRMKQLVDGNGCRRLAEEIMKL